MSKLSGRAFLGALVFPYQGAVLIDRDSTSITKRAFYFMVEIQLTRGQVARVCDCHYHLVKDFKWYADWNSSKNQFVPRRGATPREKLLGSRDAIFMHAAINETPSGFETDHIDNDSLNNQCSNLRTATRSQNQCNAGKRTDNTSGYKGVSFNKRASKWRAYVFVDGKEKHLGYFDTAELAAKAYDTAAQKYYGEFAKLNL